MSSPKMPLRVRLRRQDGIALLTTILLMLLMSSLLIGFVLLITNGQKMSGVNNDYSRAFYAAEAGMEKLTADLGTLFNKNYSPTAAQLAAISTAPPSLTGITYTNADGTSGYQLNYTGQPGPPTANVTTIQSGTSQFQGMTALATPYTLLVTARTSAGTEVKLQRTTQTVGIPMYQFGVFCDGDCSFFPGPDFNFGGRTHTNGNLFLATGGTLSMSAKVDRDQRRGAHQLVQRISHYHGVLRRHGGRHHHRVIERLPRFGLQRRQLGWHPGFRCEPQLAHHFSGLLQQQHRHWREAHPVGHRHSGHRHQAH